MHLKLNFTRLKALRQGRVWKNLSARPNAAQKWQQLQRLGAKSLVAKLDFLKLFCNVKNSLK